MDQQAYYPLTSASNYVTLKTRSPSVCRSDSASLLLDSGSILSVTDSERTISTLASSTSSEYFSLRSTNIGSSTSLADSVRTVSNSTFSTRSAYSKDIRNAAKLLDTDLVVVFMGPTGSGKSHIIDTLVGQPGRRSGSRLESCTTEVRAVRVFNHENYGDRLVLVDTPGFDDTNKSDLEILEMVSKWLQEVYEKDIKLAGIIYLHRITDNRTAGSPHRNLRMFAGLCGDQAVKKVILVTTMWDKQHHSTSLKQLDKKPVQDRFTQREKDLFENYWKTMISYGASTGRFTNSPESAWNIIDTILFKVQETNALLLQEEIVDLKRALNETEAGKVLYSDLQKLLAEQRDTIRSLAQQAREQGDPQLVVKLEAELKIIQNDFDKTFNAMKNLKIPIGKRVMLLFSKKSRARALRF